MPQNAVQTITVKQAKAQINHFGRSLVIYILILSLLFRSKDILSMLAPSFIQGIDLDIFILSVGSIALILISLITFGISSKLLDLNIRDYLRKSKLSEAKFFVYICLGIGISLISTGIASLFDIFLASKNYTLPFVGNFSTTTNLIKNAIYFFEVVLIIPICDEYIFRGVIQRQLGHYGRGFGVLGSAFLYGISQRTLAIAIPAFFVGWFLSLIVLKTHSIRPAIRIHISIAFFLWLIEILPGKYIWIVTLLLILIYMIDGLAFFSKRVSAKVFHSGSLDPSLWKILLSTSSILICIILFIINVILSFQS